MQPRIYTYKVTFEEIPHWYWGVHKESEYEELYLGSPSTHAWMWEVYTPVLQVLEIFPCDEQGWGKAQEVENRCIKPDLNNPLCLNEHYGSVISLSSCSRGGAKGGKTGGQRTLDLKVGIHGRSLEQRIEHGREVMKNIHSRKDEKGRSIEGVKAAERLQIILTPQQKTERSKKAAETTNSQLWESTIDGFSGRACSVSLHNKANGWDPAAKVRIK